MAHSEQTKQKISEATKGRTAWNKGINKLSKLTEDEITEIINWYENHSLSSTFTKFNLDRVNLTKLLKSRNIKLHTGVENNKLSKLENHGDANYNNREQASETCAKTYGYSNVAKVPEIRQKGSETLFKRTGYINNFQNPTILNKAINNSTTPEKIKQRGDTLEQKTGYRHPNQNPKTMSKVVKKNKSAVASDGSCFDSSYEVIVYEYALKHNLTIERGIPIEYIFENKKHITLIDFKIDNYLIETKGNHLLSGCFDYEGVPISVKLEVYKNHKVNVISEFNDYIDINLFRNDVDWNIIKENLVTA